MPSRSWTSKHTLTAALAVVVLVASAYAWRQHRIVREYEDRFARCQDMTSFLRRAPAVTRPPALSDASWASIEALYTDEASRLVDARFSELEARYRDPDLAVEPAARAALLAMLARAREGDRTRMRVVVRDETPDASREVLSSRGVELDRDSMTSLSVYAMPVFAHLLPRIVDVRNPFETTPDAELELEIVYRLIPGAGRYETTDGSAQSFEALGFVWQLRVRAGDRELDALDLSTSPDELLELMTFYKLGAKPPPMAGNQVYFEMARTAARELGLALARRYGLEPAEAAIEPADWNQHARDCEDALDG